eukprot:scaffold1328_cov394-Prasinococcus_capsulatus_cf.AAC.9
MWEQTVMVSAGAIHEPTSNWTWSSFQGVKCVWMWYGALWQVCLALTLTVSVALASFIVWQLYLKLSAQTAHEFNTLLACKRRARRRGEKFVNTHDRGKTPEGSRPVPMAMAAISLAGTPTMAGWRRNFQSALQVQGKYWWIKWLIPSRAPSPFQRRDPHYGSLWDGLERDQ